MMPPPGASERFTALQAQATELSNLAELMGRGLTKHLTRISDDHKTRWQSNISEFGKAVEAMGGAQEKGSLYEAWEDYWKDAAQRMVLTMDTLRQRGDIFLDHEEAGCPPVLIYDYEVVLDGADLPRPSCYMLLKIIPPADLPCRDPKPWKRPYIIMIHGPDTEPGSAVSNRTVRWALPCMTVTRSTSLPSSACRRKARHWRTSPMPRRPSCARSWSFTPKLRTRW